MTVPEVSSLAACSADNRVVATLRRGGGGDALVVHDRAAATSRTIWTPADEGELGCGAAVSSIAISSDGRVLAFVTTVPALAAADGGLTLDPSADLHLYDVAARRRVRFGASGELDGLLASVPLIREVALSADGGRLGFIAERRRGAPGQAEAFVYDRIACDLVQASPAGIGRCTALRISGDGRSLFFAAGARGELHACDLLGGGSAPLALALGDGARPRAAAYSVSHDGRFVTLATADGARRLDRATGAVARCDARLADRRAALDRPRAAAPAARPSGCGARRGTRFAAFA